MILREASLRCPRLLHSVRHTAADICETFVLAKKSATRGETQRDNTAAHKNYSSKAFNRIDDLDFSSAIVSDNCALLHCGQKCIRIFDRVTLRRRDKLFLNIHNVKVQVCFLPFYVLYCFSDEDAVLLFYEAQVSMRI